MPGIFCIVILGLLSIVADANHCTPAVNEETEKCVERVATDSLNVTAHQDEFVAKMRETLETENLPPNTVKYYFFTSDKLDKPIKLTATKESFKDLPYDKNKPLAFGVHGYITKLNLTRSLMGETVKAVVNLNKYNVIFVDYSVLNSDVLSVVAPKAFLAAKDMVHFLKFLMNETGTKREDIHIIGISLGGQVSGRIGHLLPGIGRISGLDPGGAMFTNFPKDLRLDRSDANFVDVIHTSGEYPLPKGWGYYKPCGHLDFYPNGGKFQPGCGSTIPIDEEPKTIKEIASRICMHQRMMEYYVESTSHKCKFIGTMCESYEKYKKGECSSRTAVMGEFAVKPSIDLPEDTMFFLETNGESPYCKCKVRSFLKKISKIFG